MGALQDIERAVSELTAEGQMFALESVHVRGYDYRCYANQPASLREYFQMALGHGEKTLVVHGDKRYSYADTMQYAAEFAAALAADYGVVKGDRVAIAMRNNPQWMFAFIGVTAMGAIAVPMNAWWTTEELDYGLRDCGAKVVVVDPERASRLQPIAGELELKLVSVGDCSDIELPCADFMTLLGPHSGADFPATTIEPEDDAFIMYTSGSTGHPKGAVSTHRAVLSAIFSWLLMGRAEQVAAEYATEAGADSGDVAKQQSAAGPVSFPPCALCTVPLFHATGSHSLFMLSLAIGRKIVLMDKWDVQEAMRLIETERVTNFNGVPTMSAELQAAAADSPYDLSSLKEIVSGGAARPPDQVGKIVSTFKKSNAMSGYGLTETNALGAVNSGAFYVERPSSTGRAVPAVTDFKIIDASGNVLTAGERGEVCMHSPANVRGYWNKPEATAEAFIEGWFHTGDVGYLDEDGFLYIVDRIKDIIIRGGENISCIEVEAAIYQHEAVEEAAVFGLPDARLGESVGAAVVLRPGASLDAEALRLYLKEHLAGFKIPAHIWFCAERLPRIASGKIFKRQLKADYTAELAQQKEQV